MFEIFKQDIKIGDKVKLYLTTGKEPEGIVISIGENFVLLKANDNTQNRFFDKLIGGWEVIITHSQKKESETDRAKPIVKTENIDKEILLEKVDSLRTFANKLDIILSPNANITEVRGTTCLASNSEFTKILILNNRIVDEEIVKEIELFQTGSIIPVVTQYYTKDGKSAMATVVAKPNTLINYVDLLEESIKRNEFYRAALITQLIKKYITRKNNDFKWISNALRIFTSTQNKVNPTKLDVKHVENKEYIKAFKKI